MTTILTVGNSEGERRCDAKCHDAKEPDCDCICGGRYHGKGGRAEVLLQDDILKGWWGNGVQAIGQAVLGLEAS